MTEPEDYVESDEPTPMRDEVSLFPTWCRIETRFDTLDRDKLWVREVWFNATGQRVRTGAWR